MYTFTIVVIVLVALYASRGKEEQRMILYPKTRFPNQWKLILEERINFYQLLDPEEKLMFERKVHIFLTNVRIIGLKTSVDDTDRLLVASGAVIPIFRFTDWHYHFLHEVRLCPDSFNTISSNKKAIGLVGGGHMEGKMLLSKTALHYGFENSEDKKNVAIHEFTHLIDKQDGEIDGIPKILIDNIDVSLWLDLIYKKTNQINQKDSGIRGYAVRNRAEFMAVITEHFFERPINLKENHPDLYFALQKMFKHDLEKRKVNFFRINKAKNHTLNNDQCPCGSGKIYKLCCVIYLSE